MRTVHVAPLHRRNDTRIFLKECTSLAKAGIDVTLVVADGQGDETSNGVRVLDCGRPPDGKFAKRLVPLFRAARMVRRGHYDLVHFHDGMFLPFAIALALTGHHVIYDVHEDYREQVLNTRFPPVFKRAASKMYAALEWIGSRFFVSIIAATPHIATRFPEDKTIAVQNFPVLEESEAGKIEPYAGRGNTFAYVGGLSVLRGAAEMVEAVHHLKEDGVVLELMGSFSPESLQQAIEALPGWDQVRFRGWLARDHVTSILNSARVGLVLFHPGPNHLEAQPNKLFEYMAMGLPVIASAFPLWRRIIESAEGGLLVDPLDSAAIADAMKWILDHPDEAEKMGKRGRQAVLDIYNWDREVGKLIACYGALETNLAQGGT